jgi:hypothetical protein
LQKVDATWHADSSRDNDGIGQSGTFHGTKRRRPKVSPGMSEMRSGSKLNLPRPRQNRRINTVAIGSLSSLNYCVNLDRFRFDQEWSLWRQKKTARTGTRKLCGATTANPLAENELPRGGLSWPRNRMDDLLSAFFACIASYKRSQREFAVPCREKMIVTSIIFALGPAHNTEGGTLTSFDGIECELVSHRKFCQRQCHISFP